MSANHSKVVENHESGLSSSWKNHSSFWAFCSSRLTSFFIWEFWMILFTAVANFASSMRRLQFLQWINHLHLFDPQHSFWWKTRTSSRSVFESYFSKNQEWLWIKAFVELQLRHLLSIAVNWRTHSRRPSCKCRNWNCASVLFVIFLRKEFSTLAAWGTDPCSLRVAQEKSLRMISGWIKRTKLIN